MNDNEIDDVADSFNVTEAPRIEASNVFDPCSSSTCMSYNGSNFENPLCVGSRNFPIWENNGDFESGEASCDGNRISFLLETDPLMPSHSNSSWCKLIRDSLATRYGFFYKFVMRNRFIRKLYVEGKEIKGTFTTKGKLLRYFWFLNTLSSCKVVNQKTSLIYFSVKLAVIMGFSAKSAQEIRSFSKI